MTLALDFPGSPLWCFRRHRNSNTRKRRGRLYDGTCTNSFWGHIRSLMWSLNSLKAKKPLKNKASKNIKTIRTRVTLLILFASINTFPNLLSYKKSISLEDFLNKVVNLFGSHPGQMSSALSFLEAFRICLEPFPDIASIMYLLAVLL